MNITFHKKIKHLEATGANQVARNVAGKGKNFVLLILLYSFLIGISFVLLYPLLYSISTTFRIPEDMYDPNVVWIPTKLTINNFTTIWNTIQYPLLLKNTMIISVGSSLVQVAVCAITGYGFARFKFKEKGILLSILILTVILPPQIASIPNYFMMKNFDVFGIVKLIGNLTGYNIEIKLLDTFYVYFLPAIFGMGLRSGLFILIFRQFFRGLPGELEDSSYVDGAGPITTFIRIMAPNCRAAIVIVFLFSLVWYWNDSYYGFMYLDNLQTISMRLSQISADVSQIVSNYVGDPTKAVPYIQAGVLLSITPLLLLYLACQKVFVESVERIGIVG